MIETLNKFMKDSQDPALIETFEKAPFSKRLALKPAKADLVQKAKEVMSKSSLLKNLKGAKKGMLESAFYLAWDCLDEGHEIISNIAELDASYLHCVMHRVEGDMPNASYWYRRSSACDLHDELANLVANVIPSSAVFSDPVEYGKMENKMGSEYKKVRQYEFALYVKEIVK
ncbi:hypothetical protein PQO03_14665 [Lentisphaera profundi]|uniref:Uncharacterized protein n=1 Tax=Lentisphaera profundi TaxID=1658616 RepID=A0ABY7VYA7_9BACT|nr:hypothetical protein [Lentisphaera profundi]WDE99077.1 hypothetical protein PQO03_14665 [Lentisphaera profundi]